MIPASLRIFLTDDDEDDRLIFKEILEEMDVKTFVQTTGNCEELFTALNRKNSPLPHLLFLDLNMPQKNGIECLKEIRSNREYDDISIAIYSASTDQKDIDETFQHGANIYITKPNDYTVLKNVLNKAVSMTHLNQDTTFNRSNFVLKI